MHPFINFREERVRNHSLTLPIKKVVSSGVEVWCVQRSHRPSLSGWQGGLWCTCPCVLQVNKKSWIYACSYCKYLILCISPSCDEWQMFDLKKPPELSVVVHGVYHVFTIMGSCDPPQILEAEKTAVFLWGPRGWPLIWVGSGRIRTSCEVKSVLCPFHCASYTSGCPVFVIVVCNNV